MVRAGRARAGGFGPAFSAGGPEEQLAADLLMGGWELRYVPEVDARRAPDRRGPRLRPRRLGPRLRGRRLPARDDCRR